MRTFVIALALGASIVQPAAAVPVTLVKLTGLAGANGGTAIYKADLSGLLASIASVTIADSGSTVGGANGQFTAFDLDAARLSTVDCADAACAATAASAASLTIGLFSPGSQRVPTDPKLFGTGPTGMTVDGPVATLDQFDAFSSVVTPAGFLSLGDGGAIGFNLAAPLSTTGLFLYLGEVGDNGETAASAVTIASTPVPEPAALALFGLGVLGLGVRRRSTRG